MAWQTYDDDCPGCRPVVIDPETLQPLPIDHPAMQAMLRVWDGLTLPERRAFHRFTCLNSRAPADVLVIQSIQRQLERGL
jgi:hypothetical protein